MSDGQKSAIVKVAFDGDEIEAVRDGDQAWVVVKRVCRSLGIDSFTQGKKLREYPWATTRIILAVGADGKVRGQMCLDLDALPMWLATINASKVKPALRPKLVRYQRECARVLRDAFFGAPVPKALAMDFDHVKGEIEDISNQLRKHPAFSGRVSDSSHAVSLIRNTISGAADALGISVPKMHGLLRKELGISGYQFIPFNYVDHAVRWLQAQAKDTRVVKIAKQLTLWPMGGK